MRYVSFQSVAGRRIGVVIEEQICDLQAAYRAALGRDDDWANELASVLLPFDMNRFLHGRERSEEAARMAVAYARDCLNRGESVAFVQPLAECRLLAPVPFPGKIICVGLNYMDHAAESGSRVPEQPVLFSKYNNAIIGPGEAILLPSVSSQVDYEAELAVVIGKAGKNISKDEAMNHVFGYTLFNDISARDLQFIDQWMKGKTLDTFAPTGPWIVEAGDIADPHALGIRLRLNGKEMQSSSTAHMIFDIPTLISYISRLITLEPGDLIATGTPAGVGFVRKPPVFLRPGDEVEVEIEQIGVLRNRVVAEGA